MNEFYWLCGYLEGEGSFLKGSPSKPSTVSVQFTTTDEDIASKISILWEVGYRKVPKKEKHHKQAYVVVKRGKYAEDLMRRMRPHMSQRRQSQIDAALSCVRTDLRNNKTGKLTDKDVRDIRKLYSSNKFSNRALAKKFDIDHSTISRIGRNISYKWVK